MEDEHIIPCKLCNSGNTIKYGKYNGVQLYYCKDCHTKFKDDDTLFHMKTPANQVSSALNMYYEGMSIKGIQRNLTQEYGNIPSTATIYEWIQKYTQYATDSVKDYKRAGSPEKLSPKWKQRRRAFIARHGVQYEKNPTPRHRLALIAWAHDPERGR